MTIICWKCGKTQALQEGDKYRVVGKRYWCSDCCECAEKTDRSIKKMKSLIRKHGIVENCIKVLEKQGYDLYEYKDAIDTVTEAIRDDRSKIQSSLEMAVVVELLYNEIRIQTQAKCAGYRLDIVLPEHNVVVEVDGDRHKYNKDKDAARDIYVHEALGDEWEVVRLKAPIITTNLKNIFAHIIRERERQQKYRKNNDGMVPWTYNQNEYTEIYRLGRKLKPVKEKTSNNPI